MAGKRSSVAQGTLVVALSVALCLPLAAAGAPRPRSGSFGWLGGGLTVAAGGTSISLFTAGPISAAPGTTPCFFLYTKPIAIGSRGTFQLVGRVVLTVPHLPRSGHTFRVSVKGQVLSPTKIKLSYSFSDLTKACSLKKPAFTATPK